MIYKRLMESGKYRGYKYDIMRTDPFSIFYIEVYLKDYIDLDTIPNSFGGNAIKIIEMNVQKNNRVASVKVNVQDVESARREVRSLIRNL